MQPHNISHGIMQGEIGEFGWSYLAQSFCHCSKESRQVPMPDREVCHLEKHLVMMNFSQARGGLTFRVRQLTHLLLAAKRTLPCIKRLTTWQLSTLRSLVAMVQG